MSITSHIPNPYYTKGEKRDKKRDKENTSSTPPAHSIIRKENLKTTESSRSSIFFSGSSNVSVGYGILFLLFCSCVSVLSQSQATPKATIIQRPVEIGGRTTIECSLGSNQCRRMYWVFSNGTVLHDGLGYNMTFLQSYCLGYLTFYAYSPAKIRCLIELNSENSTSGIVIIQVPNEIGIAINSSTTDDTGLHGSSNSSEGEGTDRSTATPVDDMQFGNNFTGSGSGVEKDDLTTGGIVNDEDSDGQINIAAYIAVPVVVFVISVLLGTVLAVICVTSGGCCCCRSRKTHNIRLIRKEKANHSDEQQKKEEVAGKPETTDAGGVQATDEETDQNKFVVPMSRVGATAGDLTAQTENLPEQRHQGHRANHRSSEEIVKQKTLDEIQQRPDMMEMHEQLPWNQDSYSGKCYSVVCEISHPLENIATFQAVVEGPPISPDDPVVMA